MPSPPRGYNPTVVFQWDPTKARRNSQKHGVTFVEASSVFGDPLAAVIPDPDHSTLESRWITVGMSDKGRLLMVSHMDCGEDCIRIISARLALRHERAAYEEAKDNED